MASVPLRQPTGQGARDLREEPGKIDENAGKTWEESTKSDFADFRKAGLECPDMAKVEKLLVLGSWFLVRSGYPRSTIDQGGNRESVENQRAPKL